MRQHNLWHAVLCACSVAACGIGDEALGVHAVAESVVPTTDDGGPYAIGHTHYTIYDQSRPGARPGEDKFAATGRPIVVSVWYPVDRASVGSSTPPAIYPLDALYGIAPDTTSADWEAYGIDRAYEGVAASAAGPFPLLVFSPGASFPEWAHVSLGTRLASHGFVVAVLYHWGSGWWPWEPFDHLAVMSYNRPRDMSFALTDLATRNDDSSDVLMGTMRLDQVAAGGWSLGGYAALVLAGAGDDSVCDAFADPTGEDPPPDFTCAPSFPDARFKAALAIDGSSQLLHFQELARVDVPSIGIGEEWDTLAAMFGPPMQTWQARQHAAISGRPGYRVDVAGVIHPSFSDFCEMGDVLIAKGVYHPVTDVLPFICGPDLLPSGEVHRIVSKYATAFLKAHLAGESGYDPYLTPGYVLDREPNLELFTTEKANTSDADWPPESIYFAHQPGAVQARQVRAAPPVSLVGLQ